MNAVVVAVGLMLILSLSRVHVVIALIVGALAGGLLGGLGLEGSLSAFNKGLGGGATVALSYALLGAFAVAIAKSGLAHALADKALSLVGQQAKRGTGLLKWAMIGFIMIAAAGFAEVMRETGQIGALVETSAAWVGNSKALGALLMLLVGLLVTMGIGSSFSTVPIIAAIFVPLGIELGFSPLAIVSLVGTAGALGDAGSPASDSTLGPTAGLNVDGQHNHVWDTVVPTFLHYNLPLLAFGWLAAMVL